MYMSSFFLLGKGRSGHPLLQNFVCTDIRHLQIVHLKKEEFRFQGFLDV
jgi:hypothetical protein